MRIIIPMAGRGSRLRPHTLTVPKPVVPVAGKPIVQRLVEYLASSYGKQVEEVAFIIGDFGKEVETNLLEIAKNIGAKGTIYYQNEPLGTAHAILCAKESLSGPCIVGFADTIFRADFTLDENQDGIIWVKRVEDPSAYGVVQLDDNGVIEEFVEKPETFVSDMAIIGVYYFKDGDNLRDELQYLLDNDIKEKGEYQLTNALENMKQKGKQFKPGVIEEWLDCGNKSALVYANQRVLEHDKENIEIPKDADIENSIIIQPCYIGKGASVHNSVIGPYVSIGNNTKISNSLLHNCVIQNETIIKNANLKDAMIGNKAHYEGRPSDVSIGDYSIFNA